jgi:hypothetical protein
MEKIRPHLAAVFLGQAKAFIIRGHRVREAPRDRYVDRNLFRPSRVKGYAEDFLEYVNDRLVVGHSHPGFNGNMINGIILTSNRSIREMTGRFRRLGDGAAADVHSSLLQL